MSVILLFVATALSATQTSPLSPGVKTLVTANNAFGLRLLAQIAPKTSTNVLLSPMSVSSNLTLLLAGSHGQTYRDLAKTLGLPEVPEKSNSLAAGTLIKSLNGHANGSILIANSIWTPPNLRLKPDFVSTGSTSFNASVQPLDGFGRVGANQINAWVDARTKHRISELYDSIPRSANLVLVNAVTFDGEWVHKFSAGKTRPQTFHGEAGDQSTEMMNGTMPVELELSENATIVRLPYTNGSSLTLCMPTKGHDLVQAAKQLMVGTSLGSRLTNLFLPKFKFTDQHELEEPLSAMGMEKLFKRADLSGISSALGVTRIGSVLQKSYIEVDEDGTKAAAATGTMSIALARANPPPTVLIDHPFAFVIRDDSTGTLLCAGVVRNLK